MSRTTRRTFAPGEVIFHEGDPADSLHLIVRGHVAATVTSQDGQQLTFRIMGEDEVVGEMAILSDDQVRSATVRALDRTETLVIRRRDFDRLRQSYPAVAELMIQILADRVRHLSDLLREALYDDVQTRILRRLVELARQYGEGPDVVVPLTQYHLADLAGTARATVNRVLRVEEGRQSLRLDRGRITVVDLPALAKRAGISLDGTFR
jgi:CRP-like cAMP-binding protein